MMRSCKFALLLRLFLASLTLTAPQAFSAGTPTPPGPVAVYGGTVSLTAGTTTANVALPESTASFPIVQVINAGTVEAFVAQGTSGVTASLDGLPIEPGAAASFWLLPGSTNIAAITASSSTTLRIVQWNGAPVLAGSKGSGGGGGSGTVTSVSVASANGLSGTVANPSTTPTLTLGTTASGVLKGSGGGLVAATPGTDYGTVASISVANANGFAASVANGTSTPVLTFITTSSGILKGSAGAVVAASAGTDYLNSAGGTLSGPLSFGVMNRLSRNIANAVVDNPYDNPAMSAPAWAASKLYSQADRVSVSSNIYEQEFGQSCTSAASGGPSGTGNNIVDGTCIWKYLPGVVAAYADMPTVTLATQWGVNIVFNPGATTVVYTGSGASAVGNFYTLASGSQCTAASSGSGPSGTGTGISDGTCSWNYKETDPTALFSFSSVNSFLWNGGAGNMLAHLNVYGGTPLNSVSTGYMAVKSSTVNSAAATSTSRFPFITNAAKFVVRDFEVTNAVTLPSAWRLLVCRVDGTACHYVSPTPYTQTAGAPAAGWGRHIVDFGGVAEPRMIQIEFDGSNQLGGIDIPLTADLYKPAGLPPLSMAIGGDSYPAGGGTRWGPYTAFSSIVADRLGIANVINTSVGGCGYIVTCSSGTQITRISDLLTANSGACADIYMDANGTNDVAGSTPAAIVTAMLTVYQQIRTACGPYAPIFKIGVWAHNNGNYAAGIAVENAEATAIADVGDPYYIWIPVLTDPGGPWQTGTGTLGAFVGSATFATNVMTVVSMTSGTVQLNMPLTSAGVTNGTVPTAFTGGALGQTGTYTISSSPGTISTPQPVSGNAQNGSGNTDFGLEGQGTPQASLHPNSTGNRVLASRMFALIRSSINAGNY